VAESKAVLVPAPAPRILVVKLSSIGDVVMATPTARALRRRFPRATIEWLVEAKSAEVVLGNPHLDAVHVLDRRRWHVLVRRGMYGQVLLDVGRFLLWLRKRRYDIAIDLQGLFRSAVFTLASGARMRVGSRRSREGSFLALTHRVEPRPRTSRAGEHYLYLLTPLGVGTCDCDLEVAVSPDDYVFARSLLEENGISSRFAALCPATTRPQKHWTERGFAQTADLLESRLGLPSVILGSAADVGLAQRISKLAAHPPAIIAGKTSLKQAAALLAQATLVVTVDNGPLHLAVAMKRPVVGLFGPTPSERYRDEPGVMIVRHDCRCSPCRTRPACPGYPCMATITPDEVLSAAATLLRNYAKT